MDKQKNMVKLREPLVVVNGFDPVVIEQYRILYTKIEHISMMHSYKTFSITSSLPGEGKTITSLNIAYLMAKELNKKVILVECDLKKPSLLPYFSNTKLEYGLVDVLKENVDIKTAVIQTGNSNLYILPTLQKRNNSIKLLGLPTMTRMLDMLKEEFDYIIIDSPPILPLADMNIISKIVDGLILIVMANKTPQDIVKKSVNSLDQGNIVGIILNRSETFLKKYSYYYYG